MLNVLGGGEKMDCMFLKSLAGYNESIPGYEYNPELAKEYLAKTAYNGEPITLYTRNASRSSQSPRLWSLCYTAAPHQLSVLHMVVYVCIYTHTHICVCVCE